jgi:hypothetical protein
MERDMTIGEHGAGRIEGWDGWEIVDNERGGLTILSPRTSLEEVGRDHDDSDAEITITEDRLTLRYPDGTETVFGA